MSTLPCLSRVARTLWMLAIASSLMGCAAAGSDEAYSESNGTSDLQLGEVAEEASNVNPAAWANATQCKAIPVVPALTRPEITISLDGLTLHLRDRAGTYDRVFPIGPGALGADHQSDTPTSDSSPTGLFYTGSDTREVTDSQWGYYYPCRIWWSDSGTRLPVFAGLPFIRLSGPPTAGYGIHGPVDRYTAPNGGALRRGYVSHGCVRMAAEDIVEVYARIRGRARTPVRIQREIERDATGAAVDLASRWIGAECGADADCNYAGGTCHLAAGETRGTCTLACTHACPDREGEAPTFCATNAATGTGMCVPASNPTFNNSCTRYESRLASGRATRPDRSATATACVPRG